MKAVISYWRKNVHRVLVNILQVVKLLAIRNEIVQLIIVKKQTISLTMNY